MLTIPRNEDYLFIGIQCLDLAALPPVPSDPDNPPTARIYRDVDGAPVVATEIAGGVAILVKQVLETGFYGTGLPITPTTPLGRYWVRITYDVGGVPQAVLVKFEVVAPGNSLLNAVSAVG